MTSTHPTIDWPLLLEELRLTAGASGNRLTFRDIAHATDVSHVTLINYSTQAASPLHANGERLIEYWMRTTGKQRHQLPVTYLVVRVRRAG